MPQADSGRSRNSPARNTPFVTDIAPSGMHIHPTALVADSAVLGSDVHVGAYSIIGPKVVIGSGCRLHSHVVIEGDTQLGDGNELFSGCCLGARPQDKKLAHGDTGGTLRIGDHNTLREHVTIHPGTPHGQGETRIGSNGMFLVGSHVGHDSTVGDHVVLTNGAMVAGHTGVGDRVILGAMVGVHQFARVGELAMVGAGAMLSLDAPPFSLIQGDRARLVGVNLVGLQRAGVSQEIAGRIKKAYRLLFWRSGTLTERLEAVRATDLVETPQVRRLVEFVEGTHRGICSPRSRRLQVDGDGHPIQ